LPVSSKKRLEQFEQECHTRGVTLIYDDLRGEGGLCRLRESYWLILNRRLAPETKVRIIADALARVPTRAEPPEPAEPDSVATPIVEDYPSPGYEEPLVGVPATSGVPDSLS